MDILSHFYSKLISRKFYQSNYHVYFNHMICSEVYLVGPIYEGWKRKKIIIIVFYLVW